MRYSISKRIIIFSYFVLIVGIILSAYLGKVFGPYTKAYERFLTDSSKSFFLGDKTEFSFSLFIAYGAATTIIWVMLYGIGKILQHQEAQSDILSGLKFNIYEVEETESE